MLELSISVVVVIAVRFCREEVDLKPHPALSTTATRTIGIKLSFPSHDLLYPISCLARLLGSRKPSCFKGTLTASSIQKSKGDSSLYFCLELQLHIQVQVNPQFQCTLFTSIAIALLPLSLPLSLSPFVAWGDTSDRSF